MRSFTQPLGQIRVRYVISTNIGLESENESGRMELAGGGGAILSLTAEWMDGVNR